MVSYQKLQHCAGQEHQSLLHASEGFVCRHYNHDVRTGHSRIFTKADTKRRAIYAIFLGLTIYSLIPTREARQAHNAKQAEKKAEKEKWANSPSENDMSAEEQWQHMWELQQLPRTPGTVGGMKSPMTPRTKTFNELGGTTAYTQLDGARKPGDLETGQYGYGYGNSNLQPVQTGYGNGNLQPVQTAWYGGAPGATQNVSPIAEQEEYTYEGKGKRNTMSAY
jgi:hypothetical protein